MNISTYDASDEDPRLTTVPGLKWLIVAYSVLTTIGLIGNVHLAWTHGRPNNRPKRQLGAFVAFIFSTACINLVIVALIGPLYIAELIHEYFIIDSLVACRLINSSHCLLILMPPVTLAAMIVWCACRLTPRAVRGTPQGRAPRSESILIPAVIMLVLIVITLILTTPYFVYSDLVDILANYESSMSRRCVSVAPEWVSHTFRIYAFALGALVPSIVFVVFFLIIFCQRTPTADQSSADFARIRSLAKITSGLFLFYLICSALTWLLNIFATLDFHLGDPESDGLLGYSYEARTNMEYVGNILSFSYCCGYPILYVSLRKCMGPKKPSDRGEECTVTEKATSPQ